jgi:hypothetical protein
MAPECGKTVDDDRPMPDENRDSVGRPQQRDLVGCPLFEVPDVASTGNLVINAEKIVRMMESAY